MILEVYDRSQDLGAEPPATNGFLRFSHIKTLILADFLWKKNIPVPAVTAENAKIF